ncbi:hypothetical protein CEXT_319351 [Caerostris extrusa]|uniref:Uncharacterized protein n=1 Tax=Caerostris extrusa TaxID=172846 RepID=A0AAV4R7S8_CAEEX|nr:hypothetical protein CEXT_319351 [Caerostris extrusa]
MRNESSDWKRARTIPMTDGGRRETGFLQYVFFMKVGKKYKKKRTETTKKKKKKKKVADCPRMEKRNFFNSQNRIKNYPKWRGIKFNPSFPTTYPHPPPPSLTPYKQKRKVRIHSPTQSYTVWDMSIHSIPARTSFATCSILLKEELKNKEQVEG